MSRTERSQMPNKRFDRPSLIQAMRSTTDTAARRRMRRRRELTTLPPATTSNHPALISNSGAPWSLARYPSPHPDRPNAAHAEKRRRMRMHHRALLLATIILCHRGSTRKGPMNNPSHRR